MSSLATGENLSSKISFLSGLLAFEVIPTEDERKIDIEGNRITLYLQLRALVDLNKSTETGILFVDHGINVKLEKDFKCLTDRGEDESNLFVNPRSGH